MEGSSSVLDEEWAEEDGQWTVFDTLRHARPGWLTWCSNGCLGLRIVYVMRVAWA